MYSLRRTVAVRFSFTMFVALLLIALWAYGGARRILRDSLDSNLAAAAQIQSAVLASRLPIAIQLQAPVLEESRLLFAGSAFQAATQHHTLRPHPNSPSGTTTSS